MSLAKFFGEAPIVEVTVLSVRMTSHCGGLLSMEIILALSGWRVRCQISSIK